MGSLKVWNGTAWEATSAQGPAGPAPVTSVDARTGAVVLSDLYMSTAGNWTAYTPLFASTGNPTGAGLTPGTGGFVQGVYRMIAPYTMAIRVRFQWGSTGGNGGGGAIGFGLPAGYSSAVDQYQYLSAWLYHPNGGIYPSLGEINPNATLMLMRCIDATNSQLKYVDTSVNYPSGWYPSGAAGYFGVLNVAQRL